MNQVTHEILNSAIKAAGEGTGKPKYIACRKSILC